LLLSIFIILLSLHFLIVDKLAAMAKQHQAVVSHSILWRISKMANCGWAT